MFTMAIGLKGQARHAGRMPAKAMRLAALLGALILLSVAVNALTILADGNLRPRSAAAGNSLLMASAEKLACDDKLVRPVVAHPFRGATAPALNHFL